MATTYTDLPRRDTMNDLRNSPAMTELKKRAALMRFRQHAMKYLFAAILAVNTAALFVLMDDVRELTIVSASGPDK